jgi:hypothetical protein
VRTAQQRFFDDLDTLAEGLQHEVTVEYSYSNTGRVTLTEEGSYEPKTSFSFQFSNGHNVFRGPDGDGLFAGTGGNEDMYLAKDVRGVGVVLDCLVREMRS